jgi:hypothetical protein
MDIETFRKRFVNHSDEELILMLTTNANKYNSDSLIVAREILIERNIDIEILLNNENDLTEEEIEIRDNENFKHLKAKFNRNIFVGFVILMAGLIFPIKLYGAIILYGIAFFGIILIVTGILGRVKLKNTSKIIS